MMVRERPLVRFVRDHRGRRMIRAGYLERIDRAGRLVITCPELDGRRVRVPAALVLKREDQPGHRTRDGR